MNLPITSRVKRSPLLKTTNEIATGSKVTPGKDITTIETKEKDSVGAYRRACGSTTDGSTKTDPKTGDSFKCAQASKGNEPKETETITTTKKGEDKVVDVDLKRAQHQDVMAGPWEQRRILRQGRMIGRQKNRYKRKLEKYGTFDKDGNFTEKEGLSPRQQRKSLQFQEGLARTESARERTDEGIASGYRPKERIKRKEDRDATTGEFSDKEQTEMGARRQEIAAASGITTSQAEGAPMPGQTPFSGMMDTAKKLSGELELNYKPGQYSQGITMKPSAFKMKAKSPATKKLQGNQSRLPQHLQDSIKAAPESPTKLGPLAAIAGKALVGAAVNKLASSNKMRSGFKMKGYGKK